MKRLVILILFAINFIVYGQLTPINPFEDITALTSVVVQGETILVSTDKDKLVRSSDAGLSWSIISANIPSRMNKLHSPATGIIYGCGAGGKIIRSTDSGITWSPVQSGTTSELFDVSSVNSTLLFACGADGKILKSTNGGESWAAREPVPFRLNAIKFSSPQTGWAVGDYGVVLKTTDAGDSWSRVSGASADCNFAVIALYGLEGIYILGREGQLLASNNGGSSWRYEFSDFYMEGDTVVAAWTYGRDTVVYADDRGALSMARITPERLDFYYFGSSEPATAKYYHAFRTDDKKFYVVGEGPSISRAVINGSNWTSMITQLSGKDLRYLRFSGDKIALVSDPSSSQVFISYNGGVNWNLTKSASQVQDLQANGSGKLFITDIYSWYSADTGKTWKKFNNPSGFMKDVVFLDDMKGCCIIYYSMPVPSDPKGRFYTTTNGGASWVQKKVFDSWRVLDLFANPGGLVWITQEVTSELLTSFDHGETFSGVYLPVQGDVAGGSIDQKGYLAFTNGKVIYTSNGGVSFSTKFNNSSFAIKAVSNSINGNSLIVGNAGKIIASTDHGATWQQLPEWTSLDLTSVWLMPDLSFIVTTSTGEVLKGERPGIFTGVEGENVEVPAAFTLGNYPNPFNSSTVINFTLPNDSDCRLEVFSPVGSRVFATEIRGVKGINNYSFDASSLNSGVYLYRLTAGGKALTGKMIYLK